MSQLPDQQSQERQADPAAFFWAKEFSNQRFLTDKVDQPSRYERTQGVQGEEKRGK